MAWIESHSDLKDHDKLRKLCKLTGWEMDRAIGKLHLLWWWAIKYAEDGDLSRFENEQIAFVVMADEAKADDVFIAFVESGFVETNGLLHDWLDYAGYYLIRKYSSRYKNKLKMIWAKHGRKYGQTQDHTKRPPKRPFTDQKPTLPNLTLPNHTLPKDKKIIDGKPESLEVCKSYFKEIPSGTEDHAKNFFDYFASNGWKVGGRAPMRDWKAAARGWVRRALSFEAKPSSGFPLKGAPRPTGDPEVDGLMDKLRRQK